MMTAERLIEILETYPPDSEIMVETGSGPFQMVEGARLVTNDFGDNFAILEASL